MEPNKHLEMAEKALRDWIDSLEPDVRARMQCFQARIVEKAQTDPDGMVGVILKELQRLQGELLGACRGVQEISANQVAIIAIDRARYGK